MALLGSPSNPNGRPRALQVNSGVKKRMMTRDFNEKKEWANVGKVAELVPEIGNCKAVEAGRAPGGAGPTGFQAGNTYIWCLVRGQKTAGTEGEGAGDKVFAVDGACKTCQFPLTKGEYDAGGGGNPETLRCSCCGTKYNLLSGETLEFLPGDNPMRWVAKTANEKNGPQRLASLPTRVSQSGNIFLRLPDNTIME